MPDPAAVERIDLAEFYEDEYRVGTMLSLGASVLAFAGSIRVDSAPESQFLGVASGISLAVAYSCGKKAMQFYARRRELDNSTWGEG